jgi:hypothetical protein
MSFAFNAAPFSENNEINNVSDIERKRIARNKTIKKRDTNTSSTNNSSDVEAMMQRLHSGNEVEPNDESNDLHDFQPLPNPSSVGVQRAINKIPNPVQSMQHALPNQMNYKQETNIGDVKPSSAASLSDGPASIETFRNATGAGPSDYYQQHVIPTYYNQISENTSGNKELIEKLNYMIHLLEDQQDGKTGHVTEEVILYSFLGVFMIFIVDSFARAGKYIR